MWSLSKWAFLLVSLWSLDQFWKYLKGDDTFYCHIFAIHLDFFFGKYFIGLWPMSSKSFPYREQRTYYLRAIGPAGHQNRHSWSVTSHSNPGKISLTVSQPGFFCLWTGERVNKWTGIQQPVLSIWMLCSRVQNTGTQDGTVNTESISLTVSQPGFFCLWTGERVNMWTGIQ